MPRDKTGKNRKFGHHKDKHVDNLSEEDILKMLTMKDKKREDGDDEEEEEQEQEEEEEEIIEKPKKLEEIVEEGMNKIPTIH